MSPFPSRRPRNSYPSWYRTIGPIGLSDTIKNNPRIHPFSPPYHRVRRSSFAIRACLEPRRLRLTARPSGFAACEPVDHRSTAGSQVHEPACREHRKQTGPAVPARGVAFPHQRAGQAPDSVRGDCSGVRRHEWQPIPDRHRDVGIGADRPRSQGRDYGAQEQPARGNQMVYNFRGLGGGCRLVDQNPQSRTTPAVSGSG